MSAREVNADQFWSRMGKIYSFWTGDRHELLSKADAIVICLGSASDVAYSKTLTLHTWLFDYEMPDTLMVLCKTKVYFLASKKKVDFLSPLKQKAAANVSADLPTIELMLRNKVDNDRENFRKILDGLKKVANVEVLGIFLKEKISGDFGEAWQSVFKKESFELVDVTVPFGLIWAAKEESEITNVKNACEATCLLFNKFLRSQIIEIVDADKKMKHSRLSESCEKALSNKKYLNNVDLSRVDMCYPPIIQSGGHYSFKFSVLSDDHTIHFGAIICSLGVRYRQYCSNVIRTLLVDPNQELQDLYSLLLDVEQKVIDNLKPGAKLCDVYNAAVEVLRENKPELVDKFTKNVGFGMGIEFRESSLLINARNAVTVEKGMVFNVNVGIADIENKAAKDSEGKTVALFIGDTVVVGEDSATSLTEAAKKRVKHICMFFRSAEEEKDEGNKENINDLLSRTKRSVVLQEQLRKKQSGEERRQQHQRELAEQLNKNARERLALAKDRVLQPKLKKSNISYKNLSTFPQEAEVRQLQIYVDKKYETVILPIYGVAVPFHISMIKNISQSVEGDFTYLRINLFHPGSTIGKESNVFPTPDSTFVKELTYRSSNLKEPGELNSPSSNLNTAFRLIKEVQKKFKTREAEEREKEGIVKQDKLILTQGKTNVRLKDLFIRPNIVLKRLSGTLEAHTNGFRYTSIRGDKVDILYNNIKHAFFQPCDHEMIILLHFHLKHAILFGKRKHVDIQFFTEVGEITTDLGKHTHMHDRDDVYAEQAERELRSKLNQTFSTFCDKVEKLTNQEVEFDTPFRALGFYGVPNRCSVLLQPTSGCLVNLTDWPPFVVTLEEVELVHFERVQFHLKNFDMVFIFKDYTKKLAMVTAIPMNSLDHVKEWLDSCDIRYTEGIQSLNWPKIMKTILDDPEGFFKNGGWNFLSSESDDDEQGDDESMSEDEDETYQPSGDEVDEDEEEEEDSEDYESEATSETESEEGGSEDSGKSWSELEEEAKKADRAKNTYSDEEASKSKPKVIKKRR